MATYYKKDGEQFHFFDDLVKMNGEQPVVDEKGEFVREERLVHSSSEVGVAYCQLPDRLHIFTHGTAEGMQKWVEVHNSHSPHKASLKVFGPTTPAEVLNKAIVNSVFLSVLLQTNPF